MHRVIVVTAVAATIFLIGCGTGDGVAEQSDEKGGSLTKAKTIPESSRSPDPIPKELRDLGPGCHELTGPGGGITGGICFDVSPPSGAQTTSTTREETENDEYSTPSAALARGIFFARRPSESSGLYPSAAFTGKLVVEDGCLRMKRLDCLGSHLPVWPHDYSLSTNGGNVRLLDGEGRVAARPGDVVRVGGGEIRRSEAGPTPEQARRNYQQQRRELSIPTSCPGPLWMVAAVDGVEVIERR